MNAFFDQLCQAVQDRLFFVLANLQALFGAACPGHALEQEQVADLLQNPATQFGLSSFDLDEFPSNVRHAGTPLDTFLFCQLLVSGILVRVQYSLIILQGLLNVRMAAAGAKFKEPIRWITAATSGIDPHIGFFTWSFFLTLQANRTFINENHPALQHASLHRLVQRLKAGSKA